MYTYVYKMHILSLELITKSIKINIIIPFNVYMPDKKFSAISSSEQQ